MVHVDIHTCPHICISMGTRSEDVNLTHLQNVLRSFQSTIFSCKNNLMSRNPKKASLCIKCDGSSAFQVNYCCAVKDNKNIWEGLFILQRLTKSM